MHFLILLIFLAYFPYFEKVKVELCDLHSVCVFVYSPVSAFECLNQSLWNLVCITWHLRHVQWRTLYIPPILLCVCMCVSPIVVRQLLGIDVPTATNARNKEQLLDASYLCGPFRIKEESLGLSVYPPIVARHWPGKHVPAAMKNCWRRRFLCGPCHIKESRRLVIPRTSC
jgi:hypothetical protein